MAFLGDLIVRMGANVNPFTNALKKAQSMTKTFKDSLSDMRTTAAVFSKLAASIKAVNNQMDRLVHVSKGALNATQNLAKAEHAQAMNRLRELKMIQSMQEKPQRRTSMLDIAGGIGIASTVQAGLVSIVDMAKATVNLAADAQTAQITFEVLTGDAAKGAKLFKDIEKFAARTSFDLASAADATKSLLAAGVADQDVMNTMQLLGDLAMGDAVKLGFLSKAYTDVMNKGKLQGQEIRQFAENGVGLVGALAASMKKTNAEILAMSEAGEISFNDMKKALESLTGPGGRFFGMMARINETFTGQWNSLVENVQTFGRDLGALVLPKLTSLVSEGNKLLQTFNEMPNKAKFIGDVFEASLDVAFEVIKSKWDDTLKSMVQRAVKIDWMRIINPVGGNVNDVIDAMGKRQGAGDLGKAQQRLNGLLAQLKPAPARNANAGFEWQGPREQGFAAAILRKMKPASGDVKGALSGLFDAIGKDPIVNAFKGGVGGMLDRALLQGDAIKGTLANWLGTDAADASKPESQLAGAMQQGSQEAYSTLVQNMLSRTTDPVVKATKEQTKELIKAWAKQPAQNNKVALMAAPGSL